MTGSGRSSARARRAAWRLKERALNRAVALQCHSDVRRVARIARVLDERWYERRYPDVRADRRRGLPHFLLHGGAQDRDPNPWFDSAWYRATYLDGRADEWPIALEHYLAHGSTGEFDPCPRFDAAYYLRTNPDVAAAGMSPLEHYLRWGQGARATHPWDLSPEFDAEWYLAQNPDVRAAGVDPLSHYLTTGAREGRGRHRLDGDPLWDPDWYLTRYPDVAGTDLTPWEHYVRWGASQDRNPSPLFSTAWYRAQYPALEYDPNPLIDFAIRRAPATLGACRQRIRDDAESELAGLGSRRIEIPRDDGADLTVVVVVWNAPALTLRTLRSLASVRSTPIRTIVVDNGSDAETHAMLARVDGIEVLRNPENTGFGPAANQGVAAAVTEFVLLLNNDATVDDAAVAHARETLRQEPRTIAVGGRVRHPNGLLQEAGSLVWRDGSTEGYLRGAAYQDGRAMHRRDVDYVSAVFLMTRRAAFLDLGGFDPVYRPAYYEESDWSLRAWDAGWRIRYEPRALVDHVEFGSSASPAAVDLMTRHRAIFSERHRTWLSGRPTPRTPAPARDARRPTSEQRVLVLDDRIPLDSEGSGYPRARRILGIIATAATVTHLPLRQPVFRDWAPVWEGCSVDVEFLPEVGVDGLGAFLDERRGDFDVVMVSRAHNLVDLLAVTASSRDLLGNARLVYDSEAVRAESDEDRAALVLAPRADLVLAVSEADAGALRGAGCADVRVVGHDLPITPVSPDLEGRDGLLFVGNSSVTGSPNAESLAWLIHDVLPLVEDRLGRAVPVTVAGATGAAELSAPPDQVSLVGAVRDLGPLFRSARVFVAPALRAAGIPHKVHEAASRGMPMVVSGVLADQVGWGLHDGLRSGRDARQFADAVVDLLIDDDGWRVTRETLLATAAREFDPDAYRSTVLDALGLGANHRSETEGW